jgi:octaprenyl-diphosphate synthase
MSSVRPEPVSPEPVAPAEWAPLSARGELPRTGFTASAGSSDGPQPGAAAGPASLPPGSQAPEAAATPARALAGVFTLLAPALAELDRFLHGQLDAFEPEIRSMADYCIDRSGKRIRPALVFLAGWRGAAVSPLLPPPGTAAAAPAAGVSAELVRLAAVVELVHLATLVHDDIMDGADVRRGRRTAARTYGPTAAVLLGDALFAHALHLATQFPTTEVCAAVSESARRVCAGEIVQTLRRRSVDITRAEYMRIIDLKTAELFRVSCRLGARLAGFGPAFVEAASRFGRHLGVAYQIYDDLLDFFGEEIRTGKTLGTDLASGKLTLPLLILLERLPRKDATELSTEIAGGRPPQLALRLNQMRDFGVYAAVAGAVHDELAAARVALESYETFSPTPLLLGLCQVLESQMAALQSHG